MSSLASKKFYNLNIQDLQKKTQEDMMNTKETQLLKLLTDTLHDLYQLVDARASEQRKQINIMERLKQIKTEIKSIKEAS